MLYDQFVNIFLLPQWVIPELVAAAALSVLLLITSHWILFILYVPMPVWLAYK